MVLPTSLSVSSVGTGGGGFLAGTGGTGCTRLAAEAVKSAACKAGGFRV